MMIRSIGPELLRDIGLRRRAIFIKLSVPKPHLPPPPLEVESLARVLASEVGAYKYHDEERRAVAWVARNRAARQLPKRTIRDLVGAPHWHRQGSGHAFDTHQAATEADRALAEEVLAASPSEDPTHGASFFFEPSQQTLLHQADPARYKTPDEVREEWRSDGEHPAGVVGRIELWAR